MNGRFLFSWCAFLLMCALGYTSDVVEPKGSLFYANHRAKGCSIFSKSDPIVEGRGGCFFYTDPEMYQIFHRSGYQFQLSVSYPVWECLQMYSSSGFIQTTGFSTATQKTKAWQIPFDVGVKPIFRLSKENYLYVAVGPRYFYFHQHNYSSYVDKKVVRNGIGFFANGGLNLAYQQNFLIDLFIEYAYERWHFSAHKAATYGNSVNVGGLSFGAGFGYFF